MGDMSSLVFSVKKLKDSIVTSPYGQRRLRLRRAFTYKDIKVPVGYITNGASVPRFFWWYQPPFDPAILPAVIIHDFLCDKEQYKKADRYFKEILELLDISATRVKILVGAVRVYHKIRYGE